MIKTIRAIALAESAATSIGGKLKTGQDNTAVAGGEADC
jgi:hypothetical protein